MTDVEREVERQVQLIAARCAEIVPPEGLRSKLRHSLEQGEPLRIKYGIDPTTPDIHIGHLVPCRVIRTFQDLGHVAVLVIGDYTARIGDPTGRNAERPSLSETQVRENMTQYSEQLFRVVDRDSAEVRYQSEWFGSMALSDTLHLMARFSVAQLLTHETFRVRMDAGSRLSLHEIVYPVLQAHDSVMIDADVEIGGADQRFNCLCGRDLQRALGQESQVVVVVPLLLGADGRKMSKSFGNHISVRLAVEDVVGKVMAIPDELLEQYAALTTDWNEEERNAVVVPLASGALHPKSAKLKIAENVAAQLHGGRAGQAAIKEFERVFSKRQAPKSVPRVEVASGSMNIVELLVAAGMAPSTSEARRLISQGAVRVDGLVVGSIGETLCVEAGVGKLLRVGRRRFAEVVAESGMT